MSDPAKQVLSTEELVRAVGHFLTTERRWPAGYPTEELVRAVGHFLTEGRWPAGYQATISFEALPTPAGVRFTAHVVWTKEPTP